MFRTNDPGPDSIARTLKAGTIVRGSVEETGDKLRATVRLIDGNSGTDVDRKSFEHGKANALLARDSIVQDVAELLRKHIGGEIKVRGARAGTSNVQAWTLLQRALKLRADGEEQATHAQTAESKKSLALSDSLLAQAELLDANWVQPIAARSEVALAEARAAENATAAKPYLLAGIGHADRALAKNPRNADALEMRGRLRYRQWELQLFTTSKEGDALLDGAEKDLTTATEIDPSKAQAWNTLSAVHNQKDDLAGAVVAAQRAYEEDAFLTGTDDVLWRLYATSYDLEHFDQASKWCDEGARRFPDKGAFVRCRLWLLTTSVGSTNVPQMWGDYAKLQRVTPAKPWKYTQHEAKMLVAAGLIHAGLQDSARHVLVSARSTSDDQGGELLAREAFVRTLFQTRQDTDSAFMLLRNYLSANPGHRRGFAESQSWWWKNLKQDPRFASLVAGAR